MLPQTLVAVKTAPVVCRTGSNPGLWLHTIGPDLIAPGQGTRPGAQVAGKWSLAQLCKSAFKE